MIRQPRILFIQTSEPAAYPPVIHASLLLADAGWNVTFLSAPIEGNPLTLSPHDDITLHSIPARPSHILRKLDYARYTSSAAALALRLRPHVIYASDSMGAGPALLAARLARARLVYHEHDSPHKAKGIVGRLRATVARSASLIVFPNAARATIAEAEIGFNPAKVRIVWNLPRLAELPALAPTAERPFIFYYHGTVSPERVPEAFIEGIRRFGGEVRLRIAGYEAPGARGYLARLLELGHMPGRQPLVEYAGLISRGKALLAEAARAHVGVVFFPKVTDDVNMLHMVGASNKAFDYMAAGLPLLVSDLSDWRERFVCPGYAHACVPSSPDSVIAAISWFLHNKETFRSMGKRCREKIEAEWNYDTAFAPVISELGRLNPRCILI
jgi:glycosyltransferase involved in cell wall biosynthesis